MGGTIAGGKLAASINLKNNPDFYRDIGRKGGSAPHYSPRGFAADRQRASDAGRRGGLKSRRKPRSE
jgi:general stress protein YciG